MADEQTKETEDIEVKEGYDQEGELEEDHNGPDDDTMKFIKDSIKAADSHVGKEEQETHEEDNVSESKEDNEDEEEGEEIDEGFVEAARDAGWTDDEIQKFASEYKNEDLVDMIPHLGTSEEEEDEDDINAIDSNRETNNRDSEEDEINLDEIKDEKTRSIVEEMQKKLKETEDRLNKQEEEREQITAEQHQRQLVNNCVKANEIFDGMDSNTFGKTDDLPKFPDGSLVPTSPQFKARHEVFEKATQFHEKLDIPWETAVKDAIKLLNSNSEKEAGRKLVRQLKDHSKNLSPKRTKKSVDKQYRDEDDEKADAVRSIAREVGVELD